MRKKELKSEINELKKALETLCQILGISFEEFRHRIEVGKWSYTNGGNAKKQPVNHEEFDNRIDRVVEGINKLAEKGGYEWFNEEKVEKKIEGDWVKIKKNKKSK